MKKTINYAGKDIVLFSRDEIDRGLFQLSPNKVAYPLLLVFSDTQEPSRENLGFVKNLLKKIYIPTVDIYSTEYSQDYESLIDDIIISSDLTTLWTASDSNLKEAIENFLLTGGPGDNRTTIAAYIILVADDNPEFFNDCLNKIEQVSRELEPLNK